VCGLVAYLAYHPAAPAVDRSSVATVAAGLRHRGPDGEGTWQGLDARVCLAHTRLAVIAPGDEGAQPMQSADGTLVVSFNGEIYNHRALREDLEARGHRFRTDSDTEVLLAMYQQHGEDMLGMLRGMFAFALWDVPRQELVLARDAYGIKPLYYADNGWTFRAASEVKALRLDAAVDDAPSSAGWAGFYLFGSVPEPFTIHQGIRALPAGCVMRVGASGAGIPRRWFNLAGVLREAPRASVESAQAVLRDALLDSVRHNLVSDVPVGLFLSAGLDSGTTLALCRELGSRPLTITLAFDDAGKGVHDEAEAARGCALHYDVPNHVQRISAAAFEAALPQVLASMDQPSIDGVNTWLVSRAAAEQGLKVVLSGIGADELLGGYPSFRQLPWFAPLSRWGARVPLLGELSRRVASPLLASRGLHPKLAGVFATGGGYAGSYLLRRGLFMPWELPGIMGEDAAREGLAQLRPLGLLDSLMTPDPGYSRARVTALESGAYLRNQLLRDADWAGMAHGVEIRTPLVDGHLLRAVAPLLRGRASAQGKTMLHGVPARRLPAALRTRPRSGFHVPLEAWLARRPGSSTGRTPRHVAAVRAWARTIAEAA
jgi:asparagine synthase (glutamine-hydrolysing)